MRPCIYFLDEYGRRAAHVAPVCPALNVDSHCQHFFGCLHIRTFQFQMVETQGAVWAHTPGGPRAGGAPSGLGLRGVPLGLVLCSQRAALSTVLGNLGKMGAGAPNRRMVVHDPSGDPSLRALGCVHPSALCPRQSCSHLSGGPPKTGLLGK